MSPKDVDPKPDHTGRAPGGSEGRVGNIRLDQRDIRDRYYEPILSRLPLLCPPDSRLMKAILDPDRPLFPRDQGIEGTCGGHALAAVVDIEHLRGADPKARPSPVSARMIHTMAQRQDDSNRGDEGVSLRDVIKGFYNYGVCTDDAWPYLENDGDTRLTHKRFELAKATSLGAYFRLRPNLNDYHAAIAETGAVLISAELHDGWGKLFRGNRAAPPRSIPPPDFRVGTGRRSFVGGHAFVIVGYDEEGFVILNSWGKDWGNYKIVHAVYPGLAHWRYADWADSVMDGWVLRLGVGGASAFQYSVGEQGLGGGAEGVVRSTPVHAVLGHYLHTDDGRYVERGAFASSKATVDETFELLQEAAAQTVDRYEGLLLTLAGGLLGLPEAVEQIARTKAALWRRRDVKGSTWYPITALWCVDYVDEVRSVLEGVFGKALARIGKQGADLDRLIEDRGHGMGRAIWRDVQNAARATVGEDKEKGKGVLRPLTHLLDRATSIAEGHPEFGLCLFSEGAGVFVLEAIVNDLSRRENKLAPKVFRMLRSIDIVAPAIEHERFRIMLEKLDRTRQAFASPDEPPPLPVRLHLPCDEDEARLAVPPYGRSYFDLVQRVFEDRDERTLRARPDGSNRGRIGKSWTNWSLRGRVELRRIDWPKERVPAGRDSQDLAAAAKSAAKPPPPREKKRAANTGPLLERELIYKSDVLGRIENAIKQAGPTPKPKE